MEIPKNYSLCRKIKEQKIKSPGGLDNAKPIRQTVRAA